MANNQLKLKIPSDYPALLTKVKTALVEGQERIEAERVKTYWEAGKLIQEHILKHAGRAEYGAEVVARLAKDLNVDRTTLNRCVKFSQIYRRLPISDRGHQFKWSHFRKLIAISDDKERLQFERNLAAKGWTAEELAARIREEKPEATVTRDSGHVTRVTSYDPLTPLRGELYTYKIVERPTVGVGEDSGLLVDLGFGIFHDFDSRALVQFSVGDIVESKPKEDAYKFSKSGRTLKDLYTYRAFVERVIDGDTLKVRFDLGFEIFTRQTLRLRGLDCPEIDTSEGQAAKAFVQSHIKEAQMIIVRSSRSDKYDRYLADVFIPQADTNNSTNDLYLNNLLLENNYAVRMD